MAASITAKKQRFIAKINQKWGLDLNTNTEVLSLFKKHDGEIALGTLENLLSLAVQFPDSGRAVIQELERRFQPTAHRKFMNAEYLRNMKTELAGIAFPHANFDVPDPGAHAAASTASTAVVAAATATAAGPSNASPSSVQASAVKAATLSPLAEFPLGHAGPSAADSRVSLAPSHTSREGDVSAASVQEPPETFGDKGKGVSGQAPRPSMLEETFSVEHETISEEIPQSQERTVELTSRMKGKAREETSPEIADSQSVSHLRDPSIELDDPNRVSLHDDHGLDEEERTVPLKTENFPALSLDTWEPRSGRSRMTRYEIKQAAVLVWTVWRNFKGQTFFHGENPKFPHLRPLFNEGVLMMVRSLSLMAELGEAPDMVSHAEQELDGNHSVAESVEDFRDLLEALARGPALIDREEEMNAQADRAPDNDA